MASKSNVTCTLSRYKLAGHGLNFYRLRAYVEVTNSKIQPEKNHSDQTLDITSSYILTGVMKLQILDIENNDQEYVMPFSIRCYGNPYFSLNYRLGCLSSKICHVKEKDINSTERFKLHRLQRGRQGRSVTGMERKKEWTSGRILTVLFHQYNLSVIFTTYRLLLEIH